MKLTKTQGEIKEYTLEFDHPTIHPGRKWQWAITYAFPDVARLEKIPSGEDEDGCPLIRGFTFTSKLVASIKDIEMAEGVHWPVHNLIEKVSILEVTVRKLSRFYVEPEPDSEPDQIFPFRKHIEYELKPWRKDGKKRKGK